MNISDPRLVDFARAAGITPLTHPRMAKCRCGRMAPSADHARLFGFIDKSLDSKWSRECCRHCGCYEIAHRRDESRVRPDDYHRHAFEPRNEADQFDSFYCGCEGWD